MTNAVTGAILSVLSVVWSAAVAAIAFIVGLAETVVEWDLNLIQDTVVALQVVGTLIWKAIQRLATWFVNQTTAFLDVVAAPIKAQFTTFGNCLYTVFNSVVSAATVVQIGQFWDCFVGPVFLGAFVLSVAVTTAIFVLSDLSLGAGVLIGILIAVLASAAQTIISVLFTTSSAFEGWGSSLVQGASEIIQGYINHPCRWSGLQTVDTLFSIPSDLFQSQIALFLFAAAYINQNSGSVAEATLDLVLSILGTIFDVIAATASGGYKFLMSLLAVITTVKDVFDTLIHVFARSAANVIPGLDSLAAFSDAMGTVSFAWGIAMIATGC